MANVNCLAGMRCPNPDCRSWAPFRIQVTAVVEMYDDGSGDVGDLEHTEDSFCQCVMCSYEGTVRDFQVQKEED